MRFRVEECIRRRAPDDDEARTGEIEPTSNPLALDPLSPIPPPPGPAASRSAFALDPLSPLGNEAA